jgi:glycosyltransferase involved in cell wall biosynthesis
MLDKKKILVLSGSLEKGGTEKITSLIVNELDSNGHSVTLGLMHNDNQEFDINDGVTIVDLKLKNAKIQHFKAFSLIQKVKPQIIFSTLSYVNSVVAVLLPFLNKKIKVVARQSTIASSYVVNIKYNRRESFILRKFYKKFDKIIVQSKAMGTDLSHNFGLNKDKLVLINNPIVVNKKEVIKRNKNEKPVFITVGNLGPIKGYDRLLKILSTLNFDFQYLIIGRGEEQVKIEELIRNLGLSQKVKLIGFKNDPIKYMKDADLFLQGSYIEGFPNVLLEASSVGLPIVAFDVPGGTCEIVINGKNGYLVKDGDNSLFRDTIFQALNQDFDKDKIISDIDFRFNYDRIISEFVNVIVN